MSTPCLRFHVSEKQYPRRRRSDCEERRRPRPTAKLAAVLAGLFLLLLTLTAVTATSQVRTAEGGAEAASWLSDGVPMAFFEPPVPTPWAPEIAPDATGGAIVTWVLDAYPENYIYAQRVDGQGLAQWPVNGVPVYAGPGNPDGQKISADGAGGAIVVWGDGRGVDWNIYAQRVGPDGSLQWPASGVAVCTATAFQGNPQIASDGAGGAVMAWLDNRNGNYDIYAQRISAAGAIQWLADGVAICTDATVPQNLRITSDGAGGAIVAWQDDRNGNFDVYAQRIDSGGATQWLAQGQSVCANTADQTELQMTSDGAGGAIIAWRDARAGTGDIYAQRIDAGGSLQWPSQGAAICTYIDAQYDPQVVSDGAGGAVVTWFDERNGGIDIYAQRINATGAVQWLAQGGPVCTFLAGKDQIVIASDGAGGGIITWVDYRDSGTMGEDIYAQWIDGNGTLQWAAQGLPVSQNSEDQDMPGIVPDGEGGVVIAWRDADALLTYPAEYYAQRVDTAGTLRWAPGGYPVCANANRQSYPRAVSDGSGGAIAVWEDFRHGTQDIYAQRVDGYGDVQWLDEGTAVCVHADQQTDPEIASDGVGGAIVAWEDRRDGNYDVYVQRIDALGAVQWTAQGEPVCTEAQAQMNPRVVSDQAGGAIVAWEDTRNGNQDLYAQRIDASGVAQWTIGGVPICTDASVQWDFQIAGDDSGGAIVTWWDARSGNNDVYAQRIASDGTVRWVAQGVGICTGVFNQLGPQIAADGSGGAIIIWRDDRNAQFNIYAQRIDSAGTLQWDAQGMDVGGPWPAFQQTFQIAADGTGSAIITWRDNRSPGAGIYAQRLDPDGSILWGVGGVPVCTTDGGGMNPMITSDGAGGAIISWRDNRAGNYDIYAQHLDAGGVAQWLANGQAACADPGYVHTQHDIVNDGAGGGFFVWEDWRRGKNVYANRITSDAGGICEVHPTAIDFGNTVPVGGTVDSVFTISNAGIGTLSGSVSESCTNFSIVSGAGAFALAAGESLVVTVRFEPVAEGTHTCTVETGDVACDVQLTGVAFTCSSRLYVDENAIGAGDGTSWADAMPDLQDALSVATVCSTVTEIWVAAGTYKPTSGTDRDASFWLLNGLAIYGGFSGTETLLGERDWKTNVTILSGDIGVIGNDTDNSRHVVRAGGVDTTTLLDGFTITKGYVEDQNGGGVWSYGGSPSLIHLVFVGNASPNHAGGGMYSEFGSPTLTDVVFANNSASSGGGFYTTDGYPVLVNVVFSGNSAVDGGGMFGSAGAPHLVNVVFSENTATSNGAGMYNIGFSVPALTNVSFSGNQAGNHGGAMLNSTFSTPAVVNVIMWGNSAVSAGDAIYNESSSVPVISHSLIEGSGGSGPGWNVVLGTDEGNNLDVDPLFVGGPGDLRLSSGSPAIDAGDSTAVPVGVTTDLAGNPRINGAQVDMGAFEHTCNVPGPVVYVDASASGAGDGSSWADALPDLQEGLVIAKMCSTVTEIWVAAGTYKPTSGTDRDASFWLLNGLAIYGGFAGTESSREERDWVSSPSVLSGDIGVLDDASDNSYHVVTASGTDSTAVLDGFTITGGRADSPPDDDGAGMFATNASPTLANLVFAANVADQYGGGLQFVGGQPTLTGVAFVMNSADDGGGAFFGIGTRPVIVNAVFRGNNAAARGGGLRLHYADMELVNGTFHANVAATGGGISLAFSDVPEIVNTVLWGDSAASGAEISNFNTVTDVANSLIQGCGGSGAGWNAAFGNDGGNNIDTDPQFIGAPTDLRLDSGSPAIDAGDSTAVPAGVTTDVAGNPRIHGAQVDMGAYEWDGTVSDVDDEGGAPVITTSAIRAIYPNPFNPTVTIEFDVDRHQNIEISIYDVRGHLVRRLIDEVRGKGTHRIQWHGRNDSGRGVATGVYFVRFSTDERGDVRKIVLLK